MTELIDTGTEFGARVAEHLERDIIVWLTTVDGGARPVPSPVWFLWDGGEQVLMYSRPAPKLRNIEAHPQVALNFNSDRSGNDVVILSGEARIDRGAPPADKDPVYVAKYELEIARLGWTPASFAEQYNTPIRIRLSGLRGH